MIIEKVGPWRAGKDIGFPAQSRILWTAEHMRCVSILPLFVSRLPPPQAEMHEAERSGDGNKQVAALVYDDT